MAREHLTIGRMAEMVGIATSALRFYEREGLITPDRRTDTGYRLYSPASVEQLRFIRAAQTIGFSLVDIKALLQLDEQTSCQEVQELIKRRLAEVDAKLADLKRVQTTLADALGRCQESRKGCAVVADLKGRAQNPKAP